MPTPKKAPAAARDPKKTKKSSKKAKPEAAADKFEKASRATIRAEYEFSPEEKQQLGGRLASLYSQKEQIAAHKKDLMAQLNAQAAGVDANIKEVANKITSGREPRELDVYVIYHDPEKWQKSFYTVKDKAFVRTEIMAPNEQQEAPMPDAPPVPPPAVPKPAKGSKPAPPPAVPPGGDDGAGKTSLADALNVAAAGQDLPKVTFDPDPGAEPKEIAKAFVKAAGKAGWPQVCIALLRDEVKKTDTAHRAIETLSPHITSATVDAAEAE